MPIDPLSLTDSAWDLVALGRQALSVAARRPAGPPAPPGPLIPGPVIMIEPRASPKAAEQKPAIRFPDALRARFVPRKLIGVGGMGAVFLAEDPALGRPVAIKLAQRASDPVARERFLREAAVLARLKHENLPRVYSYGDTPEGPWMALEYVAGKHLLARPVGRGLLNALLAIASALEEIHRAGFLHRDVKPENILIADDGRPVLVDFGLLLDPGLSRLTSQGKVVGTLHYVAPEVLAFRAPSPASDFYALGVTLYSLLERVHPYPVEILAASVRRGRVLRPHFRVIAPGSPVAALLTALLDLDPEARPTTRGGLEAVLGSVSWSGSGSASADRP